MPRPSNDGECTSGVNLKQSKSLASLLKFKEEMSLHVLKTTPKVRPRSKDLRFTKQLKKFTEIKRGLHESNMLDQFVVDVHHS